MQFKEEMINTNVKIYPRMTSDASMTEVTLDEFRGNPLLLLNFLINQGFVEMGSKEYDQFVKLCTMAPLQLVHKTIKNKSVWDYAPVISDNDKYKKNLTQYLAQFDNLINEIKVIDKIRLIRLLDMGLVTSSSNDYFVLKLLHRLQEQWARFELILSAPAIEFVEAREKFQDNKNQIILKRVPNCEQHHSTKALSNCFDLNILKADTTLELYDLVYKNHLKLLSYTMAVDRNEICIFSNAKIGLIHIELLANLFELQYRAQSVGDLACTIDAINEVFANLLKDNKVHTCYDSEMLKQDYKLAPSSNSALADFLWGRNVANQPLKPETLKVRFIHSQAKDSYPPFKEVPCIVYTTSSQEKIEKRQTVKQANQLFIMPKTSSVINICTNQSTNKLPNSKRSPNSFSPFCLFELEETLKSEGNMLENSPNTKEFKHG